MMLIFGLLLPESITVKNPMISEVVIMLARVCERWRGILSDNPRLAPTEYTMESQTSGSYHVSKDGFHVLNVSFFDAHREKNSLLT